MYSKEYLKELNEKQNDAATAPLRHVVVTAGAGTGKTRVIIARAVHLLSKNKVTKPILIITFTKRAAQEIKDRLNTLKEIDSKMVNVCTFHAWCWSIIKDAPFMKKIQHYTINDTADSKLLLEQAMDNVGIYLDTKKLHSVLSFRCNIQRTLAEAIEVNCPEFAKNIDDIESIELEYKDILHEEQRLDFEDIINKVAIAVNKGTKNLSWLTRRFSTILIDEAQDTNKLQWKLLEPISTKLPLFIVGDDAQSIYGFRGATASNLKHMSQGLTKVIKKDLSVNYRSTQDILNISNELLDPSTELTKRTLQSISGTGLLPQVKTFIDEKQEASFITKELKDRKNKGLNLSDVMILVRTNNEIDTLKTYLDNSHIDYTVYGQGLSGNQGHIKDVIAVLKLSINQCDSLVWRRYLILCHGINKKIIERVLPILLESRSINVAKQRIEELELRKNNINSIFAALDFIVELKDSRHPPKKIIISVLRQLRKALKTKYKRLKAGWPKFKADLNLFAEQSVGYSSISHFLEALALDHEFFIPSTNDRISIMTVHAAKGSESKVCYVLNVSPGSYPHYNARTINQVEEERRVLYVALTRAAKKLVLTTRLNFHYKYNNSNNSFNDSYFLKHIPSDLYVTK